MTSKDPAISLKELRAELKEEIDKEIKFKTEMEELKLRVKRKDIKIEKQGEESKEKDTKIKKLTKELNDVSVQLEKSVYAQLELTRTAEATSLKDLSHWSSAATGLEVLVENKKKQLVDTKATTDKAETTRRSMALCGYQRDLGEVYMKLNDLKKAEYYTQKAYDERERLLKSEGDDADLTYQTRSTKSQLCKILQMRGDSLKAETGFNEIWVQGRKGKHDDISLDAGYELGCLYAEKKPEMAQPQFNEVWDAHIGAKATSLQLERIALQWLKTTDEKSPVLKKIWEQRGKSSLSSTALLRAEQLANIYRQKKLWAEARPIFKEAWSARNTPPHNCVSLQKNTCHVCILPAKWFHTGYRYANATVLADSKNDDNWREARDVMCTLWEKRAECPGTIATARDIANYYLYTMLFLKENEKAEAVARKSWNEVTTEFQSWESDIIILQIGERYADVLERNGKLIEARNQCEVVYTPGKTLALQSKDKASLTTALKRGRSLLNVMKKIRPKDYGSGYNNVGYDARSKQLNSDIEQLAELKKK
jgi:hypothetical protein